MTNRLLWKILKKYQVKECLTPLTPGQMEEHMLIIEEGTSAHDVIQNFHDETNYAHPTRL